MTVDQGKPGRQNAALAGVTALLGGPARIAGIALFVTVATVLTALGYEHIGGYEPCALCLKERIPYYVGAPIAAVALLAARAALPGRLVAALFVLFAVVMGYGVILGAYHAGAEWAFWQGPAACGAAGAGPANTGQLLEALKTPTVGPSCTEAVWRFAGLSFAGWNALIAAGLFVLGLIGAARAYGSSSASQ